MKCVNRKIKRCISTEVNDGVYDQIMGQIKFPTWYLTYDLLRKPVYDQVIRQVNNTTYIRLI